MKHNYRNPRPFAEGMGEAVARRTILRQKNQDETPRTKADVKAGKPFRWETWGEVAQRVADGNHSIISKRRGKVNTKKMDQEYRRLRDHIANGSILMSGRHLQHGDMEQPNRNIEVFSNCFHKNTKVLTQEYGPANIIELVGKNITVKARDGVWRKAEVKCFGKQKLYKMSFGPKTGHSSTVPLDIIATRTHSWFLEDGSKTEYIKIKDVLELTTTIDKMCCEGVQHGLIFGDGTGNKQRNDTSGGNKASQGREYCSIRLCGEDKKYLDWFEEYNVTYPPHAKGDPVVYIGKKNFWKDVPFTCDASYIRGFIHGWWLADGSKTYNRDGLEISTSNELAKDWLIEYCAYAGYRVTGITKHTRKENDGSFKNGKDLYEIRITENIPVCLKSCEPYGVDDVYCVVEPVTHGFVLANGLLTGNCSTASTSFWKFYLLLNGSGVGRSYDDDLMIIDWSKQPFIHVVLDETHPDYDFTCMESLKQVQHKYGKYDVTVFEVQDSREGWAKALEYLETLIFEGGHEDDVIIFDFSRVRCRGSLIGGMQLRASSGPVPTMNMFNNIKSLKGCKKPKWWQTMYVDHYGAESVLVGGARRSARICVKSWRDPDIIDYINIKKNWSIPSVKNEEGVVVRKSRKVVPLWSANNSVGVDEEFWKEHKTPGTWAKQVFDAIINASYVHGTGEPGILNLHKLQTIRDEKIFTKNSSKMQSDRYIMDYGNKLCKRLLEIIQTKKWIMIVNPCAEISLFLHGGYCVIADLALYHCDTIAECIEACRLAVRALIRTNMLKNIYSEETERTNRIGVSLTGIQEFAWKFFKITFKDMFDGKSLEFWKTIAILSNVVRAESIACAREYKVEVPHTSTTIKPSGSVSKLFGLTEGAHLPAMARYFRWVQFRKDDPLVKKYRDTGHYVKELKQYEGTAVVCFPTETEICKCGASPIITATEATMEEQYKWLQLLETFWLKGGNERATYGNQVSYTLKYDKKKVNLEQFTEMVSKWQPLISTCSVMPTISDMEEAEYEYLPEEPVSLETYNEYVRNLKGEIEQDVDRVHIECAGGACPVDINKE